MVRGSPAASQPGSALCHGRSSALGDESCSGCHPSQRGRRSGGSREADLSGGLTHIQLCFASYQHCLGKAAMKQRPRAGSRAVGAMGCSCHASQPLTVAPGTSTSQEAPPVPKEECGHLPPWWWASKGPGHRRKGLAGGLGYLLLGRHGILTGDKM